MTKSLATIFAAVLAALAAGGCSSNSGPGGKPGVKTTVAGLTAFESCEALGDFLESKSGANEVPAGGGTGGAESDGTFGQPAAAPADEAVTVEEADIVKQEGNRLYAMTAFGKLFAYDVSNPAVPHRIGEATPAIYPIEMYVSGTGGTKVAVIGVPVVPAGGDGTVSSDSPYYYEPVTRVTVYDFADASAPTVARQFDFKGSYGDSRKVGGALYLALQRWISEGPVPLKDQLDDRDPCDQVYVPEEIDGDFSSFITWDVIGINLNALASDPNQVSVVGSWGSTITATPDHFYLTNHFYENNETGVYLFDLDPATAGVAPRATARVPGSIVNQFSMDETDGVFRIVSTNRAAWIWGWAEGGVVGVAAPALDAVPPPPPTTTNYLTTFRAGDGSLAQLGQIDSIVPNESVTAARFLGDRAFVTTFVATDPLVTIDVSDPASPRVVGELHLPGRTDYLQAWGADRLIAIGSADGWSGVVLNLFNIADLANPQLVEQETIPNSYYSEAQYEHLAFSFFEDQDILAVPVGTNTGSELDVYLVNRDTGFTRLGAVHHDDLGDFGGYSPAMRRSLEIGGLLYSVSEAGLKVNGFSALTTDLFEEMFPGFTPPIYGCDCAGDVCACPVPL
ncbi:MAG TPA: beta-propeller domain-containing protein [bacterium]|nr:beta-propeller domain-containing protein [bacterium]